jgi:ribose 5-phosphate isomerase A
MNLKQQAAREAMQQVRSGMVLGLGSGSTAAYFVDMLGHALRSGALHDIAGVPTSESTAERARALGIPLTGLAELGHARSAPLLDLAVDGADEVDPAFNLIKGLGRALLREKIIEIHAAHLVVIVDESKLVPHLGQGPLPVEIVQFEAETHVRWLNTLGCRAELWHEDDGGPIVTDNGNYLARCWFPGGIADLQGLARTLSDRPGIVEHGLFLDIASVVIVAGRQGMRTLE